MPPGSTVLVDSGLIRMKVVEKNATSLRCRVTTPGTLTSRRHINLPGVDVNLPSLTEKDERDIRVGVEAGCDFFAPSLKRKMAAILNACSDESTSWYEPKVSVTFTSTTG